MPLELKDKYPFTVDTWSLLSRKKEHNFLTHAHSDHTSGIESFVRRRIYCSDTTRLLLLRRFSKLESAEFIILEIGETKLILDDDNPFTVTAFDANHCPGALMLLFEGNFGNVLHTGDCRLTDECLKNILGTYKVQQCVLDCVYLDCTFGKERIRIPSKRDAFEQVQQCILNHPKAPVIYLACDLLGQEELLSDLARSFRSKIFVNKELLPEYYADMKLVIPEILTEDPQSTRFHVCEGFPKLYERAKAKFMEAHRLKQEEPLFIRPSAQWYTYAERLEGAGFGMILAVALKRPTAHRHRTLPAPKAAERDQYGVWHVCYSAHSSRSELERAMEALWPKEVISTTPNCHAKEVMSGRAGLYHIDMVESSDVGLSRSFMECSSRPSERLKNAELCTTLKDVSVKRSLLSSSPTKKILSDVTTKGNCTGGPLEKVIPLFGTARYSIPPSPPMSFSSVDSHDSCDSQATELYFSDDDGEDTAETPAAFEKYSNLNLELAGEVVKEVANVKAVATIACASAHDEVSTIRTQVNSQSSTHEHIEVFEMRKREDEVISEVRTNSPRETESRVKKRTASVAALEECTRKLYRSFRVPIPSPLPSLLDLYNFNV